VIELMDQERRERLRTDPFFRMEHQVCGRGSSCSIELVLAVSYTPTLLNRAPGVIFIHVTRISVIFELDNILHPSRPPPQEEMRGIQKEEDRRLQLMLLDNEKVRRLFIYMYSKYCSVV
jgi:hypothetical protein